MATAAKKPAGLAIRWRLTIWITAAFILTIVVMFVSLRTVLGITLYRDVNSDLDQNYQKFYGFAGLDGATQPSEFTSVAEKFPFPIVVRDANGNVIASNGQADPQAMPLSEDDIVQVMVEQQTLNLDDSIRGEAFRIRSQRANLGDQVWIVQVGRTTQSIDDVMRMLDIILLAGGAVATVVVLAAGYWLARSALLPVEQITHAAAEIEASDLKRRIQASGRPTEVQRLADTFDAMLARLEDAFGQQRNFVMDVSHELRTPLTALRGNLDVMLMDKGLDADLRAQLERMSAEVGRLIRLTSNLLYLAHAEAGREIARRPVELDELCLEVIYQGRTLRDDVSLRLDHEERVTVSGDRDLLKQLVLNLLDNAIKYSPQGGEVTVSLHERGDAALIVVADRGPGIPAEQRSKIFERFYRVSNIRSRTVGGAGIGLAISAWIAQVHNGTIAVEDREGGGSRFVVTLPLSREESKVAVS